MFQHLVGSNHWCLFWPDLPHKFQRKQAMALTACPDAKARLRSLMKVFRSSRAPFAASRFGKSLKESRYRLLRALKQDPNHEVLEMFMPGIARDMDLPLSEMSPEKAIEALAKHTHVHIVNTECKDVRWGAWLDHAQGLDRVWHLETMTQLFADWEAGICPWTGQHSQTGDGGDDERVFSIKKIRWQVRLVLKHKLSSVMIKH